MQQLSLFDLGDEKPQEVRKKSTSKKEKAQAASENLFAQESKTTENIAANFSTDFIVEELEQENIIVVPESTEEIIDTNFSPNEEAIAAQEFVEKIEAKTIPEEKNSVQKRGRKSFKEIDNEIDLIDVPSDEELEQKQYYPISVVAKWFRVNTSLLRFWENQFKILKPKKNKKGDRFFRPEDVKNLKLIYHLLRQKKLTIDGANKHLKAHKEHTEENLQLINTLNNFKNFLLELKANAV